MCSGMSLTSRSNGTPTIGPASVSMRYGRSASNTSPNQPKPASASSRAVIALGRLVERGGDDVLRPAVPAQLVPAVDDRPQRVRRGLGEDAARVDAGPCPVFGQHIEQPPDPGAVTVVGPRQRLVVGGTLRQR